MTNAETVPSWFLLVIVVKNGRETELVVGKLIVIKLGFHLHISLISFLCLGTVFKKISLQFLI